MNVSLTPELEEFVSTKVSSGRYNSASEVGRRLACLDRGVKVDPAESRAKA